MEVWMVRFLFLCFFVSLFVLVRGMWWCVKGHFIAMWDQSNEAGQEEQNHTEKQGWGWVEENAV